MADNANLKSQYLAQVEADLERNTKERERIAADAAALQEQLTILEQDHVLLVGVQQTLVSTSPAPAENAEQAKAPADVPRAAVPRARKSKAAPRTPKPSATKKKSAPKAATGSTPSATPTLVELVVAGFSTQSEPRSAADITAALTQAHPERKIQTTVVRNTLEALVAKGQVLRSKQGRAVSYSAAEAVPAAASADKSAATA